MNDFINDPFAPETWDDTHSEYFEFIREQINKPHGDDVNTLISNGTPRHAVFIIAHFIENSKDKVRVLSRCLKRKSDLAEGISLWANENVISSVLKFLSQEERHFTLIVEDEIDSNNGEPHELLKAIHEAECLKGTFELRKPNREDLESARSVNYLIRDNLSIRVVTSPSPVSANAKVGFGTDGLVEDAIKFHDNLWKKCTPVNLGNYVNSATPQA